MFINIEDIKKVELNDNEIIIKCDAKKPIIEDLLDEYSYEHKPELDFSLKDKIINYISKEKRIFNILKFKDFIEEYNIQIDTSIFNLEEIFGSNDLVSIYNFLKFFKLDSDENIKKLITRIRFYRDFKSIIKLYKVAEGEVKNEALKKAREILESDISIFKESPDEKIYLWITRGYSSIIEDILDKIEIIYENGVKEEFKDLIDDFANKIKFTTSNLQDELGMRLKRTIKMRLKRSNDNYKRKQAKTFVRVLNLTDFLIDFV
jgi:hypothetical protein